MWTCAPSFSPDSSGIFGKKKAKKRGQVSWHFRYLLVLFGAKAGIFRHFHQFLVVFGEKWGGGGGAGDSRHFRQFLVVSGEKIGGAAQVATVGKKNVVFGELAYFYAIDDLKNTIRICV